jgi:hypothetical protein
MSDRSRIIIVTSDDTGTRDLNGEFDNAYNQLEARLTSNVHFCGKYSFVYDDETKCLLVYFDNVLKYKFYDNGNIQIAGTTETHALL